MVQRENVPADIRKILEQARVQIRDMAFGWPHDELIEPPEETVARITALLGDGYDYDYDSGEFPNTLGVKR